MMRFSMVALMMIAVGAGRAQSDDSLLSLPTPLIVVVKTPKPPVIDGRIGPGEWRYATATSGLLNLADGNPATETTVVQMTYDAERLYFAFEARLATEQAPAASESNRDGGVWADDSIELFLQPPDIAQDKFYHFIGNSIATVFDRFGADTTWNASWEFACQTGIDAWTAELAVPLSDLGQTDPTGNTWRVNFARNAGTHTSWSYTGRGYGNPPRFGSVRFAENAMVIRALEIEGIGTNQFTVRGEMFNPGPGQRQTLFGLRMPLFQTAIGQPYPRLGTDRWKQNLHMNLSNGSTREFRVTKAARDSRRRMAQIGGVDLDANEVFRQVIPFVPAAPQYVTLVPEPSEETAFLRADLRGLGRGEAVDLSLHVSQVTGGLDRHLTFSDFESNTTNVRSLDVRQWPLGEYHCEYRVASTPAGKTLHEGEFQYERKAAPEWYSVGKQLGRGDRVLPPWTPIEWSENGLDVLGRHYQFGDQLMLAEVSSAD